MHGVGHGLGGIAGLDGKQTEVEAPNRLEATRRLSLAWLRTALDLDRIAWQAAMASLGGPASALAQVALVSSS